MPRRPISRRPTTLLLAVLAGLVIAFGIDAVRDRARATPPIDEFTVAYEARGTIVEVNGLGIYLDCRGVGAPTVLLEGGFGAGSAGWGEVLDGIAAFSRVCAWDRPGIGRSAPRALHSAAETAATLRAALRLAGESGPYVIVAHSLGGVYARVFADGTVVDGAPEASEDGVLQVVMLDTYEPDLGLVDDPALAADVRVVIRENLASTGAAIQEGEQLDWTRTLEELELGGPLEQPGVLLMLRPEARLGDPDPARHAAIIDAWYRGIAARYPNAELVIVDTGHQVQLEQPALVIERVRAIVLYEREAP